MTDDEIASLIIRLHEKTLAGELAWEDTENEKTFKVSFARYSVAINKDEGFDEQIGEDYTLYKISIIDSIGREVDSFTPWGSYMKKVRSGETIFRETYEAARRKARGLDKALTSLLDELGRPTLNENEEPQDEIPF